MSEMRKVTKDALIYSVVNIIPIFLGFISIPIYTRIFDPAEYGQLSIVLLTANYTVIFMLTWVNSSFMRFYEAYKKKNKEKEFINTYLIMLLLVVPASVLLYGLFLAIAYFLDWFEPKFFELFVVGAFLLLFNGLINFFQTYYRAKRKTLSYAAIMITNSVFTLLAGLALVLLFKFRVDGILIGSTIVSAIVALVVVFDAVRTYGLSFHLFRKKMVTEAFRYGMPVIFTNFAFWVLRFSDRYIIEATRGASEVGLYSVSYNISDKTIMLVITALSFAITPALIASWEHKGKAETEKLLKHFSRYQYMLLLPATLGMIFLVPVFTEIFVGSEFHGGALVSQIVAAGIFFVGLYGLTNFGLYLEKKTRKIAITVLIVGCLNILLNIIFIPTYGYIVAALTTTFSYFILWLISFFQTRKILRWGIPVKSFLKITLASMVMCVFVVVFRSYSDGVAEIGLLIFGAMALYFFLLLVMGEIRKETSILMNYANRKFKAITGARG